MTDPAFDWRALDGAVPTSRAPAHAVPPTRPALLVAALVLAIATAAGGAFLAMTAPQPTLVVDGAAAFPASGSPGVSAGTFVVDVEGAVARPGLVTLPAGGRVGDAIVAAGGFGALVDAHAAQSLNLAAIATDGMQILVPGRGPGVPAQDAPTSAPDATGARAPGAADGAPLDLNRATQAQLEALPGIGPATAARILAARAEARFAGVDDLRSRKLVGASVFEKIRDLVTVDG